MAERWRSGDDFDTRRTCSDGAPIQRTAAWPGRGRGRGRCRLAAHRDSVYPGPCEHSTYKLGWVGPPLTPGTVFQPPVITHYGRTSVSLHPRRSV